MFHHSLAPWFQKIAKRFHQDDRQRSRPGRQFTRLSVELLEDRTVPSIFVVNELADTHAQNPMVSAIDSSGQVSLRSAIETANCLGGNQTIQFDPSIFTAPQTITLTLGLLTLNDPSGVLTIQGPAAGVTISGNNRFEVFRVDVGTTAGLIGLTISDGRVAGWDTDYGGGIYNNGTLTISAGTIADNVALTASPIELFGGVGGGIYNNAALTIVNSTISGNHAGDHGAGIYNSVHGTVALTDCTVTDNTFFSDGYEALGSGGGLFNSGIASVTSCTIAGNVAEWQGGGIWNGNELTVTDSIISGNSSIAGFYDEGYEFGAGGGIFNEGTATLLDSTISGNTASGLSANGFLGGVGGGVCGASSGTTVLSSCTLSNNSASGGGGVGCLLSYYTLFDDHAVTLSNCTISGNKATHNGGGIYIGENNGLTLINSTIAENTAVDGGGVDINPAAEMTSSNSTISGNTAINGGGIYIKEPDNYIPALTLDNTIVAGNASHSSDGDVVGAVWPSSVNNLIGNGTGIIGIGNNFNGNQIGTNAAPINLLLAPLGDYGGPTQTMALLPGSPAIDAGSNAAIPAGVTTDQRGLPRIVNGTVDIGAFESGTNLAPTITSVSTATLVVGQTGSFTVTTSGFPFALLSETGTLPPGVTFTDNGNGTVSIAGTPAAGSASATPYSFTIQASNSVGASATQVFALTINQAPAITSAASATLVVGQSGSFTVTTTGFPSAGLSETGTLPAGLSFTDNGNGTATIGGTPLTGSARATPYSLTIQASNGVGASVTQNFKLTIDQAPVITSAGSATLVVGKAGSFSVKVTPGVPTATKFSETGTLPKGIKLSSGGLLSGTPAAGTAGIYDFIITANNGLAVTQSFTLTVKQPPAITSAKTATFVVGQADSFTVITTGFPSAALSEVGALPAGVTFTDNGDGTATLSGTPLAGTARTTPYTFTIEADNGVGAIVKQTFKLLIG